MSRWTRIKIIIGATVSIFVILVIVLLINIGHLVNSKYEQHNINDQVENNEQIVSAKMNMNDDFINIVYRIVKKNSDWTDLPLSKSFKKKYNAENGILNDDNVTDIYGGGNSDKEKQIVVLNIKHGAKDEEYYIHYTLNENNELDDVEIVDKKLLYDENGNEVVYKVSMDKDNYEFNISRLAYPFGSDRDPRDYINMTDNYIEKYYNGFIKISGADRITSLPITKISDYNNNIVYLEVEYCIYNGDEIGDWYGPMYYKIKYATNDKLWLDDVEVEEVSKDEIDRLLSEKDEG